jgi:outer membrane lipoprotein LolB
LSWSTRSAQLKAIHHFESDGVFSLQTQGNVVTAQFHWREHGENYQIQLYGPLGIGAVSMERNENQFLLKNAQGQIFTAKNPEVLIQQQLGWTLPVSPLTNWMRGLPGAERVTDMQFDQYHHLIQFHQAGWTIHYNDYMGVSGVDLPHLMELQTPGIKLRLVIRQWDISHRG